MTKYLLIISIVFSGCYMPEIEPSKNVECAQDPKSSLHPKHEDLTALMDKYVKKGLPGMSILIEDIYGVWTGSAGFADIDKQVPFTPCQVSKGGSLTKMFIATLALKLHEKGIFNIDDPLSKYIDAKVLNKIENANDKTIRQLMNHSTGIFDIITSKAFYLAVINNPNRIWSQTDLLEFVYGQPGVALNTTYPSSYSNTNTLLLSMCIEKASGQSHSFLLRDDIIDILDFENTYYQGREKVPATAAQGYFDLHNNGTIVNVSNLVTGSGNGFTGIYSNIFDMDRFLTIILGLKVNYFLKEDTRKMMVEFLKDEDDFYTGLGLIKKFTNKADYAIGHTGRDLGYSADALYFPNRKCKMIFFVNYGTDGDSGLKPVFEAFENELADLVLQ